MPTGHQSLLTSPQQETRSAALPLSKNGNTLAPDAAFVGPVFSVVFGWSREAIYKCTPFCYTTPSLVVPWPERAGFCQ